MSDKFYEYLQKYSIKHVDSKMHYDPIKYDIYRAYGPLEDHAECMRHFEVMSFTIRREAFERMVRADENYSYMVAQELYETSMRDRYPSVQAAYDHYQLVLKLAK